MTNHRAVGASRTWGIAAAFGVLALAASPAPSLAQAKACARTAPGTWTVTGIVASGQSLGTCAPNTAWSRVVPLKMTSASLPTGNTTAGGTISLTQVGGHMFVGITVSEDEDLSDLDQVVLVFDKENDKTANDGDFFLRVVIGPATKIISSADPSKTVCQVAATVQYFRYSGGSFVQEQPAVGNATIAKVAYDYDTGGDAETKLWNVELDIPMNTNIGGTNFYPLQTAMPFFAMGAYVFVDQGQLGVNEIGNVLRWPQGMAERQIGEWDQNAPAWVPNQLAEVNLNDVCFNVSLAAALEPTPWEINNQPAKDGSTLLNKPNQDNKFRVRYFYQGPGTAAAAGANPGQVRITVTPFVSGNFVTAWAPSAASVNPDQYNMHYTADFDAPPGTFPADMAWACSDLYLQNFAHDDDGSDNHIHINHNYFHTSEFTQDLKFSTEGIPNLAAGEKTRLTLQLSTTNEPAGSTGKSSSLPLDDSGRPALAGFGVLSLLLATAMRRRRDIASMLLVFGVVAVGAGCFHRRPARIGGDRWDVVNADSLGLVAIENKPGWYHLPITKGEVKTMHIHFTGRPLPYKTRVDTLAMHSDSGRPNVTTVPVRDGRIITIVATGLVDVDGANGAAAPVAASGFTRSAATAPGIATRSATGGYLLSPAHNVPAQNVGALIGSFDGFKTSFVIGTNKSIAVPKGAQQLTLGINGTAADYRLGIGKYEINIIDTPGPAVPTASSVAFDTPYDQPSFLIPWQVLYAVHVKTYYDGVVKNYKTNVSQAALGYLGEAHMSIYRSAE